MDSQPTPLAMQGAIIEANIASQEGESPLSDSDIDSDTIAEILCLPKTHRRVGKRGNRPAPGASRRALPGVAGGCQNPTLTIPRGVYNEKLFTHARENGFTFQELDGTRTIKCDEFCRLLVHSQKQAAGLFTGVPNTNRIYRANRDNPERCQLALEAAIVKREMLREVCTLERRALRKVVFGLRDAYQSDSDEDFYGFNRLHARPRPVPSRTP
ncbi:uncharacterized protein GIQ15_02554 [Arthroderma uncinatum]|uniref:uncharacterized protein n=1 Tax=Arthroderma uncinatum TaxID=74035 RepID=UPI00144AF047|nr:uncharacterized protein GIQ15_02554 [Arthroderma uncinatum]KAF3483230.1 hypothetical protein GIQ15_02554 [Arthroderma uncinatum]